jgi:hypothetical protein
MKENEYHKEKRLDGEDWIHLDLDMIEGWALVNKETNLWIP